MLKLAQFNRNQNLDTKLGDQVVQLLAREQNDRMQYAQDLRAYDTILQESQECDAKIQLLLTKQQLISEASSQKPSDFDLQASIRERDTLREDCYSRTSQLCEQLESMKMKREQRLSTITGTLNTLEALPTNKNLSTGEEAKTLEEATEEYNDGKIVVQQVKRMRDETNRAIESLHSLFTKELEVLNNTKLSNNMAANNLLTLGVKYSQQLSYDAPHIQQVSNILSKRNFFRNYFK
jgi:hypothetical protein